MSDLIGILIDSVGEGELATVRFLPDWTHQQTGDIRPGEALTIAYDSARLPNCRAERYGRPAWSIAAYVRFHPGSQQQSGTVASQPLEVSVPADATQVEMWFQNTDAFGCSGWDSRYGQNYWLDVNRE